MEARKSLSSMLFGETTKPLSRSLPPLSFSLSSPPPPLSLSLSLTFVQETSGAAETEKSPPALSSNLKSRVCPASLSVAFSVPTTTPMFEFSLTLAWLSGKLSCPPVDLKTMLTGASFTFWTTIVNSCSIYKRHSKKTIRVQKGSRTLFPFKDKKRKPHRQAKQAYIYRILHLHNNFSNWLHGQ